MSYYRECPNCGAHLDPGEACDCEKKPAADTKRPKRRTEKTARKEAAKDADRN